MATSHTYHISKVINAPLKFVYNWCVDFREDDPKIWGSQTKRIILQKTKRRVIYMSTQRRRGRAINAVRIVTFQPPTAWHLDFAGQENDEVGDYHLTSLGPRKTKLDITFKVKYKIANAPTKEKDTKQTNEIWDKYIAALERDYTRSR